MLHQSQLQLRCLGAQLGLGTHPCYEAPGDLWNFRKVVINIR